MCPDKHVVMEVRNDHAYAVFHGDDGTLTRTSGGYRIGSSKTSRSYVATQQCLSDHSNGTSKPKSKTYQGQSRESTFTAAATRSINYANIQIKNGDNDREKKKEEQHQPKVPWRTN